MSNFNPKSGSRLLGLFCVCLISAPYLYNADKQAYWTRRYKRLNMDEIISDRFTWLHHCLLHDEIERTLLKQAATTLKKN